MEFHLQCRKMMQLRSFTGRSVSKAKVRILLVEGESCFPMLRLLWVSKIKSKIKLKNICIGNKGN